MSQSQQHSGRLTQAALGLSVLALVLWVPVAVSLLGEPPAAPPTEYVPEGEARRLLQVLPEEREIVREVMRENVVALHGVLSAIDAGDLEGAAALAREAARSPGPGRRDPALRERLPEDWLAMGKQVHRGYKSAARRLDGGATGLEALGDLSEVTGACVACHVSFRVVTVDTLPPAAE